MTGGHSGQNRGLSYTALHAYHHAHLLGSACTGSCMGMWHTWVILVDPHVSAVCAVSPDKALVSSSRVMSRLPSGALSSMQSASCEVCGRALDRADSPAMTNLSASMASTPLPIRDISPTPVSRRHTAHQDTIDELVAVASTGMGTSGSTGSSALEQATTNSGTFVTVAGPARAEVRRGTADSVLPQASNAVSSAGQVRRASTGGLPVTGAGALGQAVGQLKGWLQVRAQTPGSQERVQQL